MLPPNLRAPFALIISIFVWLLLTRSSHATQSDIDCLRSVKASLHDPSNNLASWNFDNGSRSSICGFTGIECWHENDNSVLNIKLASMELGGGFPLGVVNCTAMTGLDLSNNNLHGPIPNNISHIIGFVTNLDLSSNRFSGEIPVDLANCSFLNTLKLDNNQLTGHIPLQIGQLGRMKTFSVSNNQLSGQVPQFSNATINIGADSYANNAGLCGTPLPLCQGTPAKRRTPAIVGAAVGGVTVAALGFTIGMFFYLRKMSRKKKEEDPLGNKWAKSIKGAKRIKLSMFEKKSVSKMSLNDLMKATNDFSNENIIGSGRTGTMYKALLQDGTSLMIKRLQDTQHSEKEFISEMTTLGNCKHRNLVPLIGFCLTKKERFLVYKHMPNGTLHDKLHVINEGDEIMDWPLRLKIAIRAAKGFAWLHHSCNPRIIHRNISSKCILLDSDYEPKISDFGLARLMNPVDTHLSTFVNGEFGDLGYVAPEYTRTLVATPKGDVYSFGVVLLELVTGEKPTHVAKAPESLVTREKWTENLVEWISQLSSTSDLGEAIDGFLVGKGFYSEISRVVEVACNCVLSGRQERPTMFEVYQLLRDIGRRYDFAMEDEISVDADHQIVEVIEHRDVLEIY
ncbi:probably inactive leucine-rich repeat receptor-like protein kinase at5g48380 [Phtheirospermum japonicum]|uniref:Probably inactive leucine-rich repeat receptor-like protein kinase at5g48380 n=1 Tax=Phtheirospermum japonicum TaxID=374723 RepID=A0A830CRK5_9LAMI|nr:probably inactive leucine-rich repeat receptor-like protein kinase at5g48380 [Phtheirospermum japonicum]